MGTDTPIAFVVFNRPEVTKQSFEGIRKAAPQRLFVIADGPRDSHPSDAERCAQVREIVGDVDWPCEVEYNFSEVNLGCKGRVSSGLDWVFAKVDTTIVLEDDCVAHPDFFSFCTELLNRYEKDDRVAVVTGDNFQGGHRRGEASYYFSKYNHVWGWATWKRAWEKYDGTLSFWPSWRDSGDWEAFMPDPVERRYWERIFDSILSGNFKNSWAYPWTASTWFDGGITATPNTNLVANIGFGSEATHTVQTDLSPSQETEGIGPITHPPRVEVNPEADRFAFDHHFGGAALRERRTPLGFAKWLIRGSLRRIKRMLASD